MFFELCDCYFIFVFIKVKLIILLFMGQKISPLGFRVGIISLTFYFYLLLGFFIFFTVRLKFFCVLKFVISCILTI